MAQIHGSIRDLLFKIGHDQNDGIIKSLRQI